MLNFAQRLRRQSAEFAMLVIMAITSTFMATPLIRSLLRGEHSSSAAVIAVGSNPAVPIRQ